MPLLEIQDLQLEFGVGPAAVRAVDGLSLSLEAGQCLALVGESGSGKSATALSIARLLPTPPAHYVGGRILLEGRDVASLTTGELTAVRGGTVSYVFQEPGAALNPVFRVGRQIQEALACHRPAEANAAEVIRLLQLVGVPAPELRSRSFPHELSGGLQQRVLIAMALASRPKLLVADEPTTALDVTVQAQIIELLQQLRRQLGMAVLLITHNLGIVGDLADQLAVMYAGQIVESGPARAVLRNPRHPYTQALIASVPTLGTATPRLAAIPGHVPASGQFPGGCRFHPRCSLARPECATLLPSLQPDGEGRTVRCPFGVASLGVEGRGVER